tara:strand:- start:266 stop:496 length:231 start_codon:yes stop_codon:yes gene_type:complete
MSYSARYDGRSVVVSRSVSSDDPTTFATASEAVTALDQRSVDRDRAAYKVWRDAKLKHLETQTAIGEWFKTERDSE